MKNPRKSLGFSLIIPWDKKVKLRHQIVIQEREIKVDNFYHRAVKFVSFELAAESPKNPGAQEAHCSNGAITDLLEF